MRRSATRPRLSTALVTLLLALFIAGDLETGSRGETAPSVRAAQNASALFADLTAPTDLRASLASTHRVATKVGDHELALTAAGSSTGGDIGRPQRFAADVVKPHAAVGSVHGARAPPPPHATA